MNLWKSMIAVAVGGMIGCLVRWVLALLLNRYWPAIPPGTIAANFIGCYVIGMALAFFAANPALPLEWRLFITTGFCGGLTTFSTFSAEVIALLQLQRFGLMASAIAVHVCGSLLMTLAGMLTMTWLRTRA